MGVDAEMLIRNLPATLVTDEWLKETSWKLCTSIGVRAFSVSQERARLALARTGSYYRDPTDPAPGTVYHQDGDSILADPGECLVQVHLNGRYYGIGYERGDILEMCAVAEWIEINIPDSRVFYGGDSSGIYMELFDSGTRNLLKRHLYSQQGRAYYEGFFKSRREDMPRPAACVLCPGGVYRGNQYGTGATFASFKCSGCGVHCVTNDSGITYTKTEEP